jgi:hypothetical protein
MKSKLQTAISSGWPPMLALPLTITSLPPVFSIIAVSLAS